MQHWNVSVPYTLESGGKLNYTKQFPVVGVRFGSGNYTQIFSDATGTRPHTTTGCKIYDTVVSGI